MIPDYQTLMLPVLKSAAPGERKLSDVVEEMADGFDLSEEERHKLLPSGKQAVITNRTHWARSYLKQAGLLENPRRGHFRLTQRGREVLSDPPDKITAKWLRRFPEFVQFVDGDKTKDDPAPEEHASAEALTPEEALRSAYRETRATLKAELLDRLMEAPPAFFETVIVNLLLAMGYGATGGMGKVIGQAGDDGVDGVINQDPLGVDQVYVQAKRYGEGSTVGSGAIRDFYGALAMRDVTRGIFVTTARFTDDARRTAEKLGARIVLIDGTVLTGLMVDHQVGCRVTERFELATIDESYFE